MVNKMQKKCASIIFFISVFLGIVMYSGTIDPFAPIHNIQSNAILESGHSVSGYLNLFPGFSVFLPILSLITGAPLNLLIFFPIQLLPILLLIFITIYKLSANLILSSIITVIFATSDITSNKFYLWPHGMGTILFFTIIILLIMILKSYNMRYIVLLIISSISLVFISYDLTLTAAALFLGVWIITLYLYITNKLNKSRFEIFLKLVTSLIMIQIITLFGISTFLTETFIPQYLKYDIFTSPLDGLYKIVVSYLSAPSNNSPLYSLYVLYPPIIGQIAIIKYSIFIFIIILSLSFIFKFRKQLDNLLDVKVIFLSILFMALAYGILRSFFGYLSIGTLFYPGIIGFATVFTICKAESFNHRKQKIILGLIIFLLTTLIVLNVSNYVIMTDNNMVNRDDCHYEYSKFSASWYDSNVNDGMITSDVLTRSLFVEYLADKEIEMSNTINPGGFVYNNSLVIYATSDIYPNINDLLYDNNINLEYMNEYNGKKIYYILDMSQSVINLEDWVAIKPWYDHLEPIMVNSNNNIIYSCSYIIIITR